MEIEDRMEKAVAALVSALEDWSNKSKLQKTRMALALEKVVEITSHRADYRGCQPCTEKMLKEMKGER